MIHKAVVRLLLLALVIQPLFALGLTHVESDQTLPQGTHVMNMGDCGIDAGDNDASGRRSVICNDMTSADCTLAANVGSCIAGLSAVFLRNVVMPTSSFSDTNSLYSRDRYLSIILDTLTPPPNSSKA
ncbi:hypothetical protein [Marinobacter qingdaonensis]|uniref:Uncharacterized protein n=1 Tax=Marinobacter qingdaonensis TaxID=3108486 RepID=A0ABU5NTU2_9GAMM|nr:hypothetical protein [Marinobacter sp. ASW11-75]MEA1079220.1 hypothetical protein [Marinobacter sp. ASW11-75]